MPIRHTIAATLASALSPNVTTSTAFKQSASQAGTLSLISYAVGTAAITTGLYLLLTADSKQSSAKGSLHLVPYVGIGQAGATLPF